MRLLILLLDIYSYLILAEVILSWIGPQISNSITEFIHKATEPVLAPLRKIIPPIANLDFSPFVAFIVIQFLRRVLSDI